MNESADLAAILEHFDVLTLGDGDPIIGINVLAGMACTLANLIQDNEVVRMADGSPARLGTSLLITGSASTGKVVDEIITEVTQRQNNFSANLQAYTDWIEEIKGKPNASFYSPKSSTGDSAELVYFTQSEYGELHPDNIAAWRNVLERNPGQTIKEIAMQRKFMVSVGGRKELESHLTRLQPGNPLIHLGLTKPDDFSKYADAGTALMEGRYQVDDGSRAVKANLLITDPTQVLMAAALKPEEHTRWLGQLLWLCDSNIGPAAPPLETTLQSSPGHTGKMFRHYLTGMITYRLNLPDQAPIVIPSAVQSRISKWSAFLRDMESSIPGISGAARNLFTSLALGLLCMKKREVTLQVLGIEALARFLVRRMANLRLSIMHSGKIDRKREQIKRVFSKLSTGPANARKLCRHLSMSAVERDDILRWLEATGLIVQGHDGWQIREGARLSFDDCKVPIIEV